MISKEEVHAKIDAAFNQIVDACIKWQPAPPKADAQAEPYPAKTIKFKGTYADVNKMFQKRRWSLSLPIVPPTVEKVQAMLKGTKRDPSEVVWVVPPRNGMLTVELVATLGVMARYLHHDRSHLPPHHYQRPHREAAQAERRHRHRGR